MRLVLLLLATSAVYAHTSITTKITYTKEISRLIAKRCARCHGAQAAVPLASFDDARAWAVAIREQVQTRAMPPWDAVRGFGDFRGVESLTQPEIDLFVQWVEGGAPKGEDAYLPARSPAVDAAETPRFAGSFYVRWEKRLVEPQRVAGIRPAEAGEGTSFQVTAVQPDGRVIPLLWIHNYRKKWNRTYVYREPVALAPASRIVVSGPPGTLVSVWLAPRPRTAP